VHSEQAYHQAAQATEILFGSATQEDIQMLSEQALLTIFANVPQITVSKEEWEDLADVADLVSSTTQGIIFKSKGEARRIIQGGGLSINKVKVTDPHQKPSFDLLQGRYLLVQQGRKHYYLIVVR
jgi:tyrosyl-tRNA synthetase